MRSWTLLRAAHKLLIIIICHGRSSLVAAALTKGAYSNYMYTRPKSTQTLKLLSMRGVSLIKDNLSTLHSLRSMLIFPLRYLGNNVLCILGTVQLQFLCNINQWDSGVRKADHSDAGLDDVVSEADDERVGPLWLELGATAVQSLTKQDQISIPDSYRVRGWAKCVYKCVSPFTTVV